MGARFWFVIPPLADGGGVMITAPTRKAGRLHCPRGTMRVGRPAQRRGEAVPNMSSGVAILVTVLFFVGFAARSSSR